MCNGLLLRLADSSESSILVSALCQTKLNLVNHSKIKSEGFEKNYFKIEDFVK